MFVFYFFVVACMFFVQMLTFGGVNGNKNSCMKDTPVMYWFLIVNVTIFYGMVCFGLATWGFYLCKVADA